MFREIIAGKLVGAYVPIVFLAKFEWLLRHRLSVVEAAAKANRRSDDDGTND